MASEGSTMSQFVQHPAASIKLSFNARKATWLVSLVVLAVLAATAVILLVSNGNDSSSASSAPTTNSSVYNGGHEEGTVGQASPTITLHSRPESARPFQGGGFTERYDNGLEEGTAGR